MKRLVPIFGLLALSGCGRVAELKPASGQSLPVKPLMARTTPTAKDLLTLPPYAKPARVDELMKRSEPRPPDPFDLPPATGGPAPSLPTAPDARAPADSTAQASPGE